MAAVDAGQSYPPLRLEDLLDIDQLLPTCEEDLGAMIQLEYDELQQLLWNVDSPNETMSSRSDAALSPSRYSHQASAGGSASLSPGDASLILTPTSTLLDYAEAARFGQLEIDDHASSPDGNISSSDDFVMVSPYGGESRTANRDRFSIHQAGMPASAQTSQQARGSAVAHRTHVTQSAPWPSFASSDGLMAYPLPAQQDLYSSSDLDFSGDGYASATGDDMVSNVGGFDDASYNPYDTTSFGNTGHAYPPNTFVQQDHHVPMFQDHRQSLPFDSDNSFDSTGAHQLSTDHLSAYNAAFQGHPSAPPSQRPQPSSHSLENPYYTGLTPAITSVSAAAPGSQVSIPLQSVQQNFAPRPAHGLPNHPHPHAPLNRSVGTPASVVPASTGRGHPRLVAGDPLVAKDPLRPSHQGRVDKDVRKEGRKGGRGLNSHLPEQSRAKSHQMRKVGACWRCALQRDPCDRGDPCTRCTIRSQKGQTYFFDCDRSKLPDFVHDFLPPSMTLMHQKQSIEDCVSEQVLDWDRANGIDIYLSSGYGPPLRWKLYEFKPRTMELLNQLQYFQDAASGQSMRRNKYSPPYGLLKLDTSDGAHFEGYLDQLLHPNHLQSFGYSCYEEENLVDQGEFQARLLDLMCKLYLQTQDVTLRPLLRDILRMMMITYIMGHTLTIVQETLEAVISNVRHTPKPGETLPHTSPRLANRQLKFFFAVLRNTIYEKILKWQQATLHTGGKKDATWLQTFCVMLGFAMVLEEVQRTIQIQADAKAEKNEMSAENANTEAFNACERIDARFSLLVGLFQCKYRDKKWGDRGSFGPGTPELRDPAARVFLQSLRSLVEQRYDHLKSREGVTFATENQCLYTTRLTARFLLPFLNVPAS